MIDLLPRYQALLAEADAWFAARQAAAGPQMQCGAGCSACCRGLFDITLLDAALLKSGFERLPAAVRQRARQRAQAQVTALQRDWPDFHPPYLLNRLPDERWTEMPEDDPTPCALLEDGRCLVYGERPLTCRLHGLPQVDSDGEVFDPACCSRNFPGAAAAARPELRWAFRDFYRREFALLGDFAETLLGWRTLELDTFIPCALLLDFTGCDWRAFGARELFVDKD